jgi:hypothetical protein
MSVHLPVEELMGLAVLVSQISTSYSPVMHLMLYASDAIAKVTRISGAGRHIGGKNVVGVTVEVLAGPVVTHRRPGISAFHLIGVVRLVAVSIRRISRVRASSGL